MNWIEALATIDYLMANVDKPSEVENSNTLRKSEGEAPFPETPEEMLRVFQVDEQKEEEALKTLDDDNLLHLCYLAELDELERGNPSKEEVKSWHNVTTKAPKKDHKIKTQVEGVLTEKLT